MEFSFGDRLRGPAHVLAAGQARVVARASMVSAARRFILGGAIATAAAMSSSPSVAAGREVVATETQRGRTVHLRPGERLRLMLPSNGTTGFSWTVATMPPHLHQVADRIEAPAVPPGMAGAEAQQILIFEAKRRGSGMLRLRYRQPWKGGMTGDLFLLRIKSDR